MNTVDKNAGYGSKKPSSLKLHCPSCRHAGLFTGFHECNDVYWTTVRIRRISATQKKPETIEAGSAGIRQCPNASCNLIVFYIRDVETGELKTFPPEAIDFDASNLPKQVVACLDEAVKCHSAGCYRAAALMVRRVLEELCKDQGAEGRDLKTRIAALSSTAVIPNDLIEAADELRLLGNDAAHVEAHAYDTVGQVEARLAIDLAKELLKAVYQYSSLVNRLRSLKKSTTGEAK